MIALPTFPRVPATGMHFETPTVGMTLTSIHLTHVSMVISGGKMISDRCDFEEFASKANGRDYQDIIYLADREATEAERRFFHSGVLDEEKALCGQEYAECLKGFITYMRYGIKPAGINQEELGHFDRIRKAALQIRRPFQ